ncbi:MAG: hypothetical protein ABJN26_00270 [Stappiaceae bacterium]
MKYIWTIAALIVVSPALAEKELSHPVSELYVMSMDGAELQKDVLTLTGLNSKVIWFTDRPKRQSGVADSEEFIANWPMGDDSFEVDPPNAVLVGEDADGEQFELEIELTDPDWTAEYLKLRVLPLSDELPQSLTLKGAHLFIDNSNDDLGDPDGPGSWCGQECFQPIIGEKAEDEADDAAAKGDYKSQSRYVGTRY